MQGSSQSLELNEEDQDNNDNSDGAIPLPAHKHQRFQLEDYQSLVDNLQKSDDQYGFCRAHGKRAFEFYCFDCSEALCAMCLIENQSDKHSEH